ncbi:MAG: hypothetical protein M0006_05095 [Magnetospirillum sp.]|nr:hypothetical protein [Magnetospirillum sp.]
MTGAYDTLIPPFRTIVDRLLRETAGEGWEVRRAYLTSVYSALYRWHERAPALDPESSLSGIIAAVIDGVGESEITSRLQAGIYAASALADHRQASADWFGVNPGELALLRQELAGGGTRLN